MLWAARLGHTHNSRISQRHGVRSSSLRSRRAHSSVSPRTPSSGLFTSFALPPCISVWVLWDLAIMNLRMHLSPPNPLSLVSWHAHPHLQPHNLRHRRIYRLRRRCWPRARPTHTLSTTPTSWHKMRPHTCATPGSSKATAWGSLLSCSCSPPSQPLPTSTLEGGGGAALCEYCVQLLGLTYQWRT